MLKLNNRLFFVFTLMMMLLASLLLLFARPVATSAEVENILVIVEVDTSNIPMPLMRGASTEQRRAAQIDLAQHEAEEALPETGLVTHHYESFPYSVVEIAPDELDDLLASDGITAVYQNEPFYPTLDTSTAAIGAPTVWAGGRGGRGRPGSPMAGASAG